MAPLINVAKLAFHDPIHQDHKLHQSPGAAAAIPGSLMHPRITRISHDYLKHELTKVIRGGTQAPPHLQLTRKY